MRYEVRANGAACGAFETQEGALERARQLLAADPDHVPEIIDMEAGRAFAPGADAGDQERLAKTVGF